MSKPHILIEKTL
jgi:hypothetical protein